MSIISSFRIKMASLARAATSKSKLSVDSNFYLACYPDIAHSKLNPQLHYITNGWREGRNPRENFNTLWYLQTVDGATGNDQDPLTHFISRGQKAGLVTAPKPNASMEWVRAASVNPLLPPLAREFASEYLFVLNSRLLNQEYYRSTHADIFGDPIEHFIRFGWQLGYNPCPDFHTKWYLEVNPDVAAAGMNPLIHYVKYGAREGREPRPSRRPPVQQSPFKRQKAKAAIAVPVAIQREVYLASTLDTLDERLSRLETQLGRRFSVNSQHASRATHPFEPILQGQMVRQYFVAPVDEIYSINMFFFTYCQPNGAKLKISLHDVHENGAEKSLLHEEVVEAALITDGHSFSVWPDEALNVNAAILRLTIKVLSLEPGRQFTIAGQRAGYKALCVPNSPAEGENAFALEFNRAPPRESHKTFAFISGCPGDAFRYRCEHQAEALENSGYSVDVYQPHDFPYDRLLQNYSIVVAHRVPDDAAFANFVERADKCGVMVVYDVDDLVFDPGRVNQIDAYHTMNREEKNVYLQGLKRYNAAMSRCSVVSVSTEKLRDVVEELFPNKPAFVMRNKVSQVMIEGAAAANEYAAPKSDDSVILAYFSGSRTHSKDFAACVDALVWMMRTYQHTRLLIVGHLEPPPELDDFAERIEKKPFMPWVDLPKVYCEVDINLAPLEYDNDFTAAKSELKYLEAALLGVPSICCNLGAFRATIDNGVDGLLCDSDDEWRDALSKLVTSARERHDIGKRAYENVMKCSSTLSAPDVLQGRWHQMCKAFSHGKVTAAVRVAFVTRAPIAETGGGYKKIFILAKYLADKNFDVRVHVEAIAHLADMTDDAIKTYCAKHFDVQADMIHVGHNNIGAVDIAIATNWPTAPTVAKLHSAKYKAYFIQDFEPNFYPDNSYEYRMAEQTYDEPLGFITIGDYLAARLANRSKWIRHIPFAIDPHFLDAGLARAKARRKADNKVSVLFFARPGIERRNFPAGVAALEKLYLKHRGKVTIKLYGLDEPLDLPFAYENLGKISQKELALCMAESDIHLSYSMTNISTVIYEAMACGCACVEADVESVRPMVENGVNCVLGKPDAQGSFLALDRLVTDAALRGRIAGAGYVFAQEMTEEKMCQRFEQCVIESHLARSMEDSRGARRHASVGV